MKLNKLIVTTAAILTLTTSVNAAQKGGHHHDHDHGESIPTTEQLGVYDSVDKTVKQGNFKSAMDPFIGLPVRYPVYPEPRVGMRMAVATFHNGRKIVLFNPAIVNQLGPLVMGYVLQHEYAHHDQGHMSSSPMNEANSDCQAAQALARFGKHQAIQASIRWHQSQGCNYDPRTPIQHVRQSHPCGTQRAEILMQCSAGVNRGMGNQRHF